MAVIVLRWAQFWRQRRGMPTRREFNAALRLVVPVTLGVLMFSYAVNTLVLAAFEFKDAWLHYTLATVFTLILTPATVMPVVITSQRLRRVKSELESLLRIDTLTDLPNRRAFFECAADVYARALPVAVLMIDIDHFKMINDRLGHEAGDFVLRSVAQSIRDIVDGAPANGVRFAARIGGEEFVALIEGLDSEAAARVADRIVVRVQAAPILLAGNKVSTSVSIGVALCRAGEGIEDTLRAADNACYRAKRLGRNQWRGADAVADRTPADLVQKPVAAIRMQGRI